jgi:hypothetical protein
MHAKNIGEREMYFSKSKIAIATAFCKALGTGVGDGVTDGEGERTLGESEGVDDGVGANRKNKVTANKQHKKIIKKTMKVVFFLLVLLKLHLLGRFILIFRL